VAAQRRDTVIPQDNHPTTRSKAMPNRGQTQDQGNPGRSNPGTFSPDDDETAQNEDNERQAQEQGERGGRQSRDMPEDDGADIESDDADLDDDDDDTSVSQ
jgi:hypothetical protein